MYLGSWKIDDYVPIPICCHRFSSGAAYAPTSLTYSIYEDATTTGLDEDVSVTVGSPFDSITGFYLVRRQLTAAAGFEAGKNYVVVIKATVDSVSAIEGHTFQIEAATNVASVAGASAYGPGSCPGLGIVDRGTAQSATSTTLVLRSAAAFADDELIGSILYIASASTGAGQARVITDYTSSTDTATVDTWTTTPTGTITYVVFALPPFATRTDLNSGLELVRTTINTLASQTSFTLVAGSTDDDAYNGCTIVVRDASTANQAAVGYVADYTGSTRTVTLAHDPGVFTMAVGDTVIVLPGAVHANLSRQIYGTVNDAAATSTSWVCDLPSTTNDFYNDMYLTFLSGALAGQVKKATDYVGASKAITVNAFTAAPANGDRYMLVRI